MSIQTKQTLKYLLIYLGILLIRFLLFHRGLWINPFVLDNNNDFYPYNILPFEKQFLMYMPLFFAISVIYIVVKKECLFETYLFYGMITFALISYAPICFAYGALQDIFYCAGMFYYMKLMIKHIQAEYPMVKLTDKLTKHNIFVVMLCFIAIILLNVGYIMVPKNKMVVYRDHASEGHSITFEMENGMVEKEVSIEIGNPKYSIYAKGWIIEAKDVGKEVITLTNNGGRETYKSSKTEITIDENLKFHFELDMEYIKLFYPLNLLLIIYCMIYIVILPICRIKAIIKNAI